MRPGLFECEEHEQMRESTRAGYFLSKKIGCHAIYSYISIQQKFYIPDTLSILFIASDM
jgi:hypothetical protein